MFSEVELSGSLEGSLDTSTCEEDSLTRPTDDLDLDDHDEYSEDVSEGPTLDSPQTEEVSPRLCYTVRVAMFSFGDIFTNFISALLR